MLLVVLVHVTFIGIGYPSHDDVVSRPFSSFSIYMSGSLSVICVNLFVLITGWFGIRFNGRRLTTLIFSVLFYSILVFCMLALWKPEQYFNLKSASTVLLLNSSDYWFIKSYIILYILSPVINSYIADVSKKKLRATLILFYVFQTIYGWLSIEGAADFCGGYSALSFIGLYMLARYVKLYPSFTVRWTAKDAFGLFVAIVFFDALLAFGVTYLGFPIAGRIFTYTNPLVIIEAIALVIAFSKMSFYNKTINWLASSCLAIYLLHANELVLREQFGRIIHRWSMEETTIVFLAYTLILIVIVFVGAIFLDKIKVKLFELLRIC